MSPLEVYNTILSAQGLDKARVRVRMRGDDFCWSGYASVGSGVSIERLEGDATFFAEIISPEEIKGKYHFNFTDVEDIQIA